MFDRFRAGTLLFVGLAVALSGCGTSEVDSIVVTPASVSLAAGSTVQLTATGQYGHGTHPATSQDVTDLATWSSPSASVATVSATGLVTAVGAGTIPITASMKGFTGVVSGSATITVTGGGSGGATGDVTSLSVIPGSQSVATPGQTASFLAIGTTASGATENLTTSVGWSSSSSQIATISSGSSGGTALAVGPGTATITAIAKNTDGTVATGTATFSVSGATTEPITALSILPASQSLSATGQTGQFIAIGTSGTTGLQQDVTNSAQLTWTSAIPTIATISTYPAYPAGLASGVSAGTTAISAQWKNPDNSVVTAAASVTVSTQAAPEPLLSINIVPGDTTVWYQGQTQQFLAFGTFSTAPTVRDLTNTVTWISLDPQVASINSSGASGETGGLATAIGYTGLGVIYAEDTTSNPDHTVVLSNAVTFTCEDPNTSPPQCVNSTAPVQLATLTVYNAGSNTSNWLVTAPSSSGVADLIHCGPGSTSGGSVCVGTYPVGYTVVLTESATGSSFNGWSANCTPESGTTVANSPTCTVTLNGNYSVGAIFN